MKLSSSRQKTHLIIEIIGWLSVALIILAYAMVSFDVFASQTSTYQILNFIGAIGIIFHSVAKKDYQPAALNIIWALIALIALAQLL
ncbi:MAG: hypothetical protein HZB70_02395 [Candidatus Berkelbacteria bacterium]|nr:MAG: hypothetical protein HZB70_02395 [Candidatus Berkelbacteria bacterium]QQG51840.1 MAG: hypothetical protein HY845_00600 [Candidatus Berkelbacteria bacterium]